MLALLYNNTSVYTNILSCRRGRAEDEIPAYKTEYLYIPSICTINDFGSVCCFLEQETFTPQKVLVIPRNRWLRLNMTEKLFTGTLNKNQKQKNK